ncbi:hypothetical protein ACFPFX_10800 [Streptomyces mauvecolor]|uniref:Vegetative cell wall protein gp1 n=1 Tax=Streptomyces mauvecolor TaxID=58345 RepID=A0ABV9UM64_9ACTN
MTAFLTELGKKLADKWLSVLVLPGALFLGTLMMGLTLGHGHWHDLAKLRSALKRLDTAASRPAAEVALATAALVLAAAAAGLLAKAVAAMVTSVWVGEWPRRLTACALKASHRRERWLRATQNYEAEAAKPPFERDEAVLVRHAATRNRIGLAEPCHGTWMGDRLAAVETRVRVEYGVDLPFVWPRLWLTLPDSARAELDTVRGTFNSATALAGWGLCYMAIGILWWPAALIGAATLLAACRRGRLAVASLAMLTEAAVDLHGAALAVQLGLTADSGQLTKALGERITVVARKGS